MKNKMLKVAFAFILFSILFVTSCFATTVKENADDYTNGAYIIGSTRFEPDVIITASLAANAGINEAKVNVALGKDISNLKVAIYSYDSDFEEWNEVKEDGTTRLLEETEATELEENLNIFFVNNEVKTIEVPYEGDVDTTSITNNVTYKDGKFSVPATTFTFKFSETKKVNGEKVVVANEVSTNVDKNVTTGTETKPEVDTVADNYVAKVGSEYFKDLESAIEKSTTENAVILINEVEITEPIVVAKKVTLDLNGHVIKNETEIWNEKNGDWSLISVRAGGNLIIDGKGTIQAKENDCFAIDVKEGGELTINDGKYIGNISAVYVYEGKATINGGDYSIQQLSEYNDYRYTLNCWDANYAAGTAKIIVNDGTFMNFNPINNLAEGSNTNFVVEGYKTVKEGNSYKVVEYDANNVTCEEELRTLITEGNSIKLAADINISKPIVVTKTMILDLNGHVIKNETEIWNEKNGDWSLISVRAGGNLTIDGNGTVKALENDCFAIDVKEGGELTINDGKYIGNISAVYVYEGTATINGGEYSIQQLSKHNDYRFTLNCWDANYAAGTAKIIVNDGTFMNFNPINNLAEGPNTNFVVGERKIVVSGDKYEVAKYDAENVTEEAELIALIAEGKSVTLASDIEITKPIVVNKELTLNLNGKTIENKIGIWNDTGEISDWSLISVRAGGILTIDGNGTVKALENDCFAIDVQEGGNVTVKNGKYVGNISAVYVYEGTATINGGDYSIQQLSVHNDYRFTLNCWDVNYAAGTAKIIVNDGTFMNFDPANNLAEGPNTSFVLKDVE